MNRAVSPSPGRSGHPLPVGEGKSVRPPAAGSWVGALFGLNAGCLDDRPPLLDLGFMKGAEPLRRLLFARRNLLAEVVESLVHSSVGQRCHDGGIEFGDD